MFLHAINCVHGFSVYLGPLQSRNFWSETFHVKTNLEGFAGSKASNNGPGHRSRPGTAEERHIGLGRTGQRSGPGRSARRTYGWNSPWPDDEHARGRKRSCLAPDQLFILHSWSMALHTLGLSELVNFTTDESSEELLGESVVHDIACCGVSSKGSQT